MSTGAFNEKGIIGYKSKKTKKFMNITIFYIWKQLLQVCVLCCNLLPNMTASSYKQRRVQRWVI